MNRDQQIQMKINEAVRLLCDVYDILAIQEERQFTPDKENLLSIKDFCKKNTFITNGAIRMYIHENRNNFNEKVVVRIGKKILLKEKCFFEWMNENNK